MKHLMLALLLIVQVPAPVPRQAIKNSDQPNQNNQQQAADNKTNSTKPKIGESPTKADIPKQAGDEHASQHEEKPVKVIVPPVEVRKDSADYALILANLLLTAATLVIAIYAVVQANAAKRSATFDERTVRLTQRADVLLESFEIRDGRPINGNTRILVHLKNFGPTRANDVKYNFRLTIPDVIETDPANPVPIALGAGDSQPFCFRQLSELMDDRQIRLVVDNSMPIHISGKISYTDVFSTPHTTECGGVLNPTTGMVVADPTVAD